jgi:Na+-driven multidrug efflux pump
LCHQLDRISSAINKLTIAVFLVNLFAYGRGLFATILATRLSAEAVKTISFTLSIVTVANMIIFGVMSIIGAEFKKSDTLAVKQAHLMKYFIVSTIMIIFFVFVGVSFSIFSGYNEMVREFIFIYSFALIPFIYSSAIRYVLLAESCSRIINITNSIALFICIGSSSILHWCYQDPSIISFAYGCMIAFIYNFIHLTYFLVRRALLYVDFTTHSKSSQIKEACLFIYEGLQVAMIYSSDAIFFAFITILTLQHTYNYILAIQVVLQIYLFASFWIVGFANAAMITLADVKSLRVSKRALAVIFAFIVRRSIYYTLILAVFLMIAGDIILSHIFNLHQEAKEIARIEIYLIVLLFLVDFLREVVFYILRLFNQVAFAVRICYQYFILGAICILVIKYLNFSPIFYLLIYVISCTVITFVYTRKLFQNKFSRR